MIANIQRFLYLCHIKNQLNSKRRRFYYYMNHDVHYKQCGDGRWRYMAGDKPQKHISRWHAKRGYRKAQRDMKAMTKEMREMRLQMGVRTEWDNSGFIVAIHYQGHRMHRGSFKRYYEAELFEMGLFKENR